VVTHPGASSCVRYLLSVALRDREQPSHILYYYYYLLEHDSDTIFLYIIPHWRRVWVSHRGKTSKYKPIWQTLHTGRGRHFWSNVYIILLLYYGKITIYIKRYRHDIITEHYRILLNGQLYNSLFLITPCLLNIIREIYEKITKQNINIRIRDKLYFLRDSPIQ